MQARVDWVLIILGTQVIKKKQPVWPVFPDYLSVSYEYVSPSKQKFCICNQKELFLTKKPNFRPFNKKSRELIASFYNII